MLLPKVLVYDFHECFRHRLLFFFFYCTQDQDLFIGIALSTWKNYTRVTVERKSQKGYVIYRTEKVYIYRVGSPVPVFTRKEKRRSQRPNKTGYHGRCRKEVRRTVAIMVRE